jgi:hypothetical protein
MRLEFSRQIFEKYSDVKFHENPSSGRPAVPRIRAHGCRDRQDEAVTFRNFANAPSKRKKILNSMVASISRVWGYVHPPSSAATILQ